jgi:hypothetical protein
MKHCSTTALLLLLPLAAPGAAQDEDFPLGPPIPMQGEESPQERMMRLFREVELELRRIDVLLSDAGAGETRLASVPDSGIADLLRQSKTGSESVIEGIDEILAIAAQQQGQGGGQGESSDQSGEGQQGSDNPMNDPGGQAPGDRENTPQAEDMPTRPEQAGEGDRPEPGQDGDPRSPQDSEAEPELSRNGPPPGSEEGAPAAPSGDDEWGLLPPRAREVFRSRGADDLPARYRDWIEGYYRRLNRVP